MDSADIDDECRRPADVTREHPDDHRIPGQHDENFTRDDSDYQRRKAADAVAFPVLGYLEGCYTDDCSPTSTRNICKPSPDVESGSAAHASHAILVDDQ